MASGSLSLSFLGMEAGMGRGRLVSETKKLNVFFVF
jgi:hypothetical protein